MSQDLVNLLQSMRGRDIEKMSASDCGVFKTAITGQFRQVSAGITRALLARDVPDSIWNIETTMMEGVAKYTLMPSDLIEANLEAEDERVRMAAAYFPRAEIAIEILGEYHYAGGLSVEPRLAFVLQSDDEDCLYALRDAPPAVFESLAAVCRENGFKLSVYGIETGAGEVENPAELQAAIRFAIAAIEVEGIRQAREWTEQLGMLQEPYLEALAVCVEVPATPQPTAQAVDTVIRLYGDLFRCATVNSSN